MAILHCADTSFARRHTIYALAATRALISAIPPLKRLIFIKSYIIITRSSYRYTYVISPASSWLPMHAPVLDHKDDDTGRLMPKRVHDARPRAGRHYFMPARSSYTGARSRSTMLLPISFAAESSRHGQASSICRASRDYCAKGRLLAAHTRGRERDASKTLAGVADAAEG